MRFTVAWQAGIKLNKQDEEKQQRGTTAKLSDIVCKDIKLLLRRGVIRKIKTLNLGIRPALVALKIMLNRSFII